MRTHEVESTGIAVRADETYEITARGMWSDASQTGTANGYELRRLAVFRPFRRRRVPDGSN